MVDFLKRWYNRYFGQEEAVVVFVVFVLAMLIVWALGSILIPVFAALIISYLCIPAIEWIKRRKIPELIAVVIVFSACLLVVLLTALYLLPMVWQQFKELMNNLPDIGQQVQAQLLLLAASYPEYIEQAAVEAWVNDLGLNQLNSVKDWLPKVVTFSIATLPNLLNAMIYLVIVPILVFFMLKDRTLLWEKFLRLLPDRRNVLNAIGHEMNVQIANYIRGKMMEILIVGGLTYIGFTIMGVRYAELLSLAVGLSVLIPYIGAVIVTIPVVIASFFQYGIGNEFYTVLSIYFVIQILDGNVLVPLLFSEAVNLHPIFIILAVLVFGGIWGFWGVFFAIPLATLVKAVVNAWPKVRELQSINEE